MGNGWQTSHDGGSACIFALELLQLGLLLLVLLEERFEDLLELYTASTNASCGCQHVATRGAIA